VKTPAKCALFAAARALGALWSLIPARLRRALIYGLIVVESRAGAPPAALKQLFGVLDDVDRIIAERATAYGNGTNPKHRLIGYHDFFVERIPAGSRVLDVGCGIGEVAKSIARRVPGAAVTAIDKEARLLEMARLGEVPANVTFVEGDATRDLAKEHWDVIVLSNILEHVDERVGLLSELLRRSTPECLLVRVPVFERHWHLPLRRELGVGYFSDPTHKIEHTLAQFESEMTAAGLRVVERQIIWGEIWAHCEPVSSTP